MGSVRQDLDIDSLWALADAVADAARVETLRYFRTAGLVADSKAAHFDPVTAADRASETAMRALIEAHRPDDGILGEEFGTKPSRSGLTWVLDPIDGTRSYISGTPTWGVLVALMDERGPFLGIIDQPYIRERFSGGLGRADVLGPQGRAPLKTRPARPLSDATIFTTFPEVGTEAEGRAFHAVARHARLTRYGTDCYAYALVAAGQIDLVIEAGLYAYDVAAPIAVIEAAGGVVTDWTGAPAHGGGRIIAAANAAIHAEALAILKDSLS
jgi:myo-inositol-1(or 4)-monophosphatase